MMANHRRLRRDAQRLANRSQWHGAGGLRPPGARLPTLIGEPVALWCPVALGCWWGIIANSLKSARLMTSWISDTKSLRSRLQMAYKGQEAVHPYVYVVGRLPYLTR